MNRAVPTYALYGEKTAEHPEFWGHAETIASRSSIHDWEIKPHRHDALFQILHIRSGKVEALFGGRWQAAPSPCLLVMPEGHEHGFRFSHDIDGAVMTVVSKRLPAGLPALGGFAEWLRQPRHIPLQPGNDDALYLGETLNRIESELTHATGAPAPLVENMLAAALLLAFRAGGPAPASDEDHRDRKRLEQLTRLIDLHFRDHAPIGFYARKLAMSATHLNRLARARIGKPVSRLLAERLVSEAKRDLVFTTNAVQQVAARLGFEDAAYFSRFFAQHTGLSPRTYRERERSLLSA